MPQRRAVVGKTRTSVWIEESLYAKFLEKHKRWGDFSHFVNEALRRHLKEEDAREERMEERWS